MFRVKTSTAPSVSGNCHQSGLAAILDFNIFIEDSAVSSSLLGFITLLDEILQIWQIQAYLW